MNSGANKCGFEEGRKTTMCGSVLMCLQWNIDWGSVYKFAISHTFLPRSNTQQQNSTSNANGFLQIS